MKRGGSIRPAAVQSPAGLLELGLTQTGANAERPTPAPLAPQALRHRLQPVAEAALLTGHDYLVRIGEHDAPAPALDPKPVMVPRVVGHRIKTLATHSALEQKWNDSARLLTFYRLLVTGRPRYCETPPSLFAGCDPTPFNAALEQVAHDQ